MNPFERVHELIISGKVIGPDGSWVSRTEALKEKRAFLQHVLSGEVNINGIWTHLSEINNRPLPPSSPPVVRNEFEKETAIIPPPQFDRDTLPNGREVTREQPRSAMPLPLPAGPDVAKVPPVTTVKKECTVDHGHVAETPLFTLPVDGSDGQPRSSDHKAIADSIFNRQHFQQPDHAAAPIIPGDNTDTRGTFVLPPEGRVRRGAPVSEPMVTPIDKPEVSNGPQHSGTITAGIRAEPPPEVHQSANTVSAFTIPLITKLDRAAGTKKPGTAGLFVNEVVTIRTIPLGKGASLAISESTAAGALVAVCSVEGFIDQSNSDTFHLQLMSMLESGVRFFAIDFERTVLVGSAGWGALAVAARMVKISGGRLLICSMKPEIAESFHLLQFNDVIDALPSLPDCIGAIRETIESQPKGAIFPGNDTAAGGNHDSFAELPLHEKIRTVISRSGPLSLFQIAAHLKGEQFGKVKIGPLKLYFILKDLNLESHWKRVRYFRSC